MNRYTALNWSSQSSPESSLPASPHPPTEDSIHLWRIPLDQPPQAVQACALTLSPDETARAERFRANHLRRRFTIARGGLRHLLATYLNTEPRSISFVYTPHGKPTLEPQINPNQLTFNLSHSADLALLAITRTNPIGIDLEHREPKPDLLEIAARNFTPRETATLRSLPEHQRTEAFYACWTLKEAYLKATGEGLSTPMNSFDVTFPPLSQPAISTSTPGDNLPWQAYSLTLEDHAAAIVAEGHHHSLHRAEWNPDMGQTP